MSSHTGGLEPKVVPKSVAVASAAARTVRGMPWPLLDQSPSLGSCPGPGCAVGAAGVLTGFVSLCADKHLSLRPVRAQPGMS